MAEVFIRVDLPGPVNKVYPRCMGLGLIPAMQAMMTYDVGSIRGPDTQVLCPKCKGTGHLEGV